MSAIYKLHKQHVQFSGFQDLMVVLKMLNDEMMHNEKLAMNIFFKKYLNV